jgi:hypothetical protein
MLIVAVATLGVTFAVNLPPTPRAGDNGAASDCNAAGN